MDALSDEHSVIPCLLKATPKMEQGERFIYCEPSQETTDMEGERVLRKALADSQDYFLQKGNLDIDHLTLVGYQKGMVNPRIYEIGRPVEVKIDDRVFVKGRIYQGPDQVNEQANFFWTTITETQPPMPWFPSVGGHVRHATAIVPQGESAPVKSIEKVYWNNIGFSREPVNLTVPGVSLIPIGTFAKSWIGPGSSLIYKTVEAGYGTDHATLTGGAAIRQESLDPQLYSVWNRLFTKMKAGELTLGPDPQQHVLDYFQHTEGLTAEEAQQALQWYADQRRHRHVHSTKEIAHV